MASPATDDTATTDTAATDIATIDTAAIDASAAAWPPAFLAPGSIVRVSTDAGGGQANGDSFDPAATGNGRFVAFDSFASNLVPGDTNGTEDVFVKDLRTGRIALASADAGGNQFGTASEAPSISANGRYVAFEKLPAPSDPAGSHVFVKDLRTGQLTQADTDAQGNAGNGSTYDPPSISANGRYVAFTSEASNLVPGDTNDTLDVFVKDLRTGAVTLASSSSAGTPNGVGTYSDEPSLSADGRTVAFVNRFGGVEVKDLDTGQLTLTGSAAPMPGESIGQPSLSADGRFVAFDSFGGAPALPGYNGFIQTANGSVLSHDVFVKDLQTGQLTLASADAAGNQGNGYSSDAVLSPNGRFVAFESGATNLTPDLTNGHGGVFVRDLWTGGVSLVAANAPSANGHYGSGDAVSVTNTGAVAFASQAADLVPGDTNGVSDIFLKA